MATEPGETDRALMGLALAEARKSFDGGGIPVGAVIAKDGVVLAAGHNQRVQRGNPILHGEMDCLANLGRQRSYEGMTLYTTLSPCMMCAGTIVQFRIPTVVIGQASVAVPADRPFTGNVAFLKARGVEVRLLDDADCRALFDLFLSRNMRLWLEDIGES